MHIYKSASKKQGDAGSHRTRLNPGDLAGPHSTTAREQHHWVLALQRLVGNTTTTAAVNRTVVQRNGRESEDNSQFKVQTFLMDLLEKVHEQENPDRTRPAWGNNLRTVDGLCEGWVDTFRKYPYLLPRQWNSGLDWFHATRYAGEQASRSAIALFLEAYNTHRKANSTKEYPPIPKEFTELSGELPEPASWSSISHLKELVPKGESVGGKPVEKAKNTVKIYKNEEWFVRIETTSHVTGVHVRRKNDLVVAETEKSGFVTCKTWNDVAQVLSHGYHPEEDKRVATQDTDVTIDIYWRKRPRREKADSETDVQYLLA